MGLFQQIVSESGRQNLPFLVIGGLAVSFHGYERETGDLDLLIETVKRAEWLKLFSGLGYTIFQDKDAFIQLTQPQDGEWPVDLMLVKDTTFRPMQSAGIKANLYGVEVYVPALEHLLALKLHALKHGHIERYLKDYLDVENLIRVNRVDLRSEKIRHLFEKHGTLDLYEKISRTSAD